MYTYKQIAVASFWSSCLKLFLDIGWLDQRVYMILQLYLHIVKLLFQMVTSKKPQQSMKVYVLFCSQRIWCCLDKDLLKC